MSENKTPRLAEMLGVDVEQEFRVAGRGEIYRVTPNGTRQFKAGTAWFDCGNEATLIQIINNPSLIHPVMQWTQDDIEDAKAVRRLYPDCEWVARDEVIKANDTTLYVFKSKPEKRSNYFAAGVGGEDFSYFVLPDTAFPSVTWENSPVRIADILGDGE